MVYGTRNTKLQFLECFEFTLPYSINSHFHYPRDLVKTGDMLLKMIVNNQLKKELISFTEII